MKDKKNIIYIVSGILLIFVLYFGYSYFASKKGEEAAPPYGGANGDTIFQNNDNGFSETGVVTSAAPDSSNISFDGNGAGIYNLISLMERLALDTNFFEDEKFKKLRDFTKEVAVSEEEKGNVNPFRPVGVLFAPSGTRTATSSPNN